MRERGTSDPTMQSRIRSFEVIIERFKRQTEFAAP